MRAEASNPFTLGVASGSPKDDSVVLWTRLAPDPLNGGGMGSVGDLSISLEIATDFSFTNIIQSTQVVAEARYAHSVHHVVTGLQPALTTATGSPTRATPRRGAPGRPVTATATT